MLRYGWFYSFVRKYYGLRLMRVCYKNFFSHFDFFNEFMVFFNRHYFYSHGYYPKRGAKRSNEMCINMSTRFHKLRVHLKRHYGNELGFFKLFEFGNYFR